MLRQASDQAAWYQSMYTGHMMCGSRETQYVDAILLDTYIILGQ